MTAVGVDWGSGYWIAVELGDEVSVEAYPSILNLWASYRESVDRILIDIPIGLPDEETSVKDLKGGRRLCDHEARAMLPSSISSSVFPTPCREAVDEPTYERARELNDEVLGRGLGSQSWSLVPRIQEVDVFVRDNDIDVAGSSTAVRESHPEVCFAGLADLTDEDIDVTKRKSTDGGMEQRTEVLRAHESRLVVAYEEIEEDLDADGEYDGWKRRITSTRLDDVLDAMALALTAARADSKLGSLPVDRTNPPEDGYDLPMEIVYPID